MSHVASQTFQIYHWLDRPYLSFTFCKMGVTRRKCMQPSSMPELKVDLN